MGHGCCLLHAGAASLQASPCIERYFTATPCDAYNSFSRPILLLVLPIMGLPAALSSLVHWIFACCFSIYYWLIFACYVLLYYVSLNLATLN